MEMARSKTPMSNSALVNGLSPLQAGSRQKGQTLFDVGFIQVNKPFTGIIPIKYEETPQSGELMLGVVGYPGDLKDERTGEKGAFMYSTRCFYLYSRFSSSFRVARLS